MRLAFLLTLLLGGCSLVDGPGMERDESAPIQTDRLTYTPEYLGSTGGVRHYKFYVVARFTNASPDTVHLVTPHPDPPQAPYYHFRLVGGEAEGGSAYGFGMYQPEAHRPLPVAPGAVRVDTLPVWGPHTWSNEEGWWDGALEGRMRLEYEAWGDPRADRYRRERVVSNEFEVRLR